MTTTKKINHDSLWIRINDGKSWVKLLINRNGASIRTRGPGVDQLSKDVVKLFKELYHNQKLSNGDTIDGIEAAYNK